MHLLSPLDMYSHNWKNNQIVQMLKSNSNFFLELALQICSKYIVISGLIDITPKACQTQRSNLMIKITSLLNLFSFTIGVDKSLTRIITLMYCWHVDSGSPTKETPLMAITQNFTQFGSVCNSSDQFRSGWIGSAQISSVQTSSRSPNHYG